MPGEKSYGGAYASRFLRAYASSKGICLGESHMGGAYAGRFLRAYAPPKVISCGIWQPTSRSICPPPKRCHNGDFPGCMLPYHYAAENAGNTPTDQIDAGNRHAKFRTNF